jgi:DNA-binding MarR family transcriptional regulator
MDNGHILAMGLRIAYLAMHRGANADFARFGITADQFVVLAALVEGDGVTQKELVRRIGSDPNTMSGKLARLERLGMVSRRKCRDDGRAHSVTLTKKGRRFQREVWEHNTTFRAELASLFGAEELRLLIVQLHRIAAAMEAKGRGVCGGPIFAPNPGRRERMQNATTASRQKSGSR